MISQDLMQKLAQEAKSYFEGASGCHDWTHVERVRALALHIGLKVGADLAVLEAAALLHDTGRKEEMDKQGKICHAQRSSGIAREILSKYDLRCQVVTNIIHCIESHRFRKNHQPKTLEARVLFDADKLDSIGAVGIGRAFLFAGSAGSQNLYTGNEKRLAQSKKDYSFTKEDSTFLEYEVKLKYIKDMMLTSAGKRLAEQRSKFMHQYFNQFWQEVEGQR